MAPTMSELLADLVDETRVLDRMLSPLDGATWTWGLEGAADTVRRPALDFSLVVTRRRHLLDTSLQITGGVAAEWMSLAQAFAGPPGPGRSPSSEATG